MALKYTNRCVWTPVSSGTGSFVVNTAVTGYDAPANAKPAIVDGMNYRYFAQSDDMTQWEFGRGTYDVASTTLTRVVENNSSGTTAAISFAVPPKVYMGGPMASDMIITAARFVDLNAIYNMSIWQDDFPTAFSMSGDIRVERVRASSIDPLVSMDASGCLSLEFLDIGSCPLLTSLDVSGCPLTYLDCSGSAITSLDVSALSALRVLFCYDTAITLLDVSGLTVLTELDCSRTAITSLDVSGLTVLTELTCSGTALASLDVSGCTALQQLSCGQGSTLTTINASGLTALTFLSCNNSALTSLDVSGCTALQNLDCVNAALPSAAVDEVLVAVDTAGAANGSLDLSGGTSEPPTATGIAAMEALQGKGWFVSVNS